MTVVKKLYAQFAKLINFIGYPIKLLALRNTKRVRILVVSKDSVLLIRSSIGSQKWSLPGGGIEKKEQPAAAAARELHEETGLRVDVGALQEIGEAVRPMKYSPWHFYVTFFLVELPETISPKISRPLEVLEVKWFPVTDLPHTYSPTLDIALQKWNQH